MLYIAAILNSIGVTSVGINQNADPLTEEEFTNNFTCDATWEQYVAARDVFMRDLGLKKIRKYRDKLLTETDWIETPYNQSTIANLDEWNAYRQYLRDLPTKIDQLTWTNGLPNFSSLNIPPVPQTIRKNSTGPTGTTEEQTSTGPTATTQEQTTTGPTGTN
jgi:hypothetical protein